MQLDIINEEICCFNPTINPNIVIEHEPDHLKEENKFDVEERLLKAAKKLRKYSIYEEGKYYVQLRHDTWLPT